ncbi:MAG: hypothetical protein IJ168_08680 [Eubacterium sp.]|nr:hypothetical protein [Eubacterium sp.]
MSKEKNNEEYVSPEVEITIFTAASAITTSTYDDDLGNGDDYDWNF